MVLERDVPRGTVEGPQERGERRQGREEDNSERLAAAIRTTVTQPYVEVYQAILLRAVEREEVPPGMRAKVPLLARIIPAMSDHRLADAQQPIGRAYFVSLVDDIVLPALGQIFTT